MKPYISSDSTRRVIPFPNRDVDPAIKQQKQYCVDYTMAIYSLYNRDLTGSLSYNNYDYYNELRLYGMNRQSTNKYKSFFTRNNQRENEAFDAQGNDIRDVESGRDYSRGGYGNIDWSIISPAQKISDKIYEQLNDIDFDVMAQQTDKMNGDEEEEAMWKLWVENKYKPFLDQARQNAGLPPTDPEEINDIKELKLFQAQGGFKSNLARILEKLTKYTEKISNWKEIRRRLIRDLIDLNVSFVQDIYDDETGEVKWKYLDPVEVVIQYSRDYGFDDSEFAGYFYLMPISELMLKLPDVPEEEFMALAKSFSGLYGNPDEKEWKDAKSIHNTSYSYENFKVPVFYCEWIEVDKEFQKVNVGRNGKRRVFRNKEYGRVIKTDRSVTRVTNRRYRYKCTWLPTTEYAFDYGRDYDQTRPKGSDVTLTIHGWKGIGKSITERLYPIYDAFQMNWLRLQDLESKALNLNYMINWRLISNITDGGKEMSFRDVMDVARDTGMLPYMDVDIGTTYQGGDVVPLHRLDGGIGAGLQEVMQKFEMYFRLIEQLTGLNLNIPTQGVPKDMPEVQEQVSDQMLNPMIDAMMFLKDKLATNTALRLQLGIKYNPIKFRKAYSGITGDIDLTTLSKSMKSVRQYGIDMQPRSTTKDKEAILEAAQIALQQGRDGKPEITSAQYMQIKHDIENGENLMEISTRLDYFIEKQRQRNFEEQQAAIEANNRGQLQLKQQEQQNKAMEKQMDTQGDIAVDNNQHKNKMEELAFQRNMEYMKRLEEMAIEEETAANPNLQQLKIADNILDS